MTNLCLADLLKLFDQIVPFPNSVPRSQYLLFKEFVPYDVYVISHQCCGYCTQLLVSGSRCPREECQEQNTPNANFLEIRLDKQSFCFLV